MDFNFSGKLRIRKGAPGVPARLVRYRGLAWWHLKNAAGKVQEEAGKLIGNPSQEAKGLKKQVEANAEKALGDVKEVVQNAKDALKDAVKKH